MDFDLEDGDELDEREDKFSGQVSAGACISLACARAILQEPHYTSGLAAGIYTST